METKKQYDKFKKNQLSNPTYPKSLETLNIYEHDIPCEVWNTIKKWDTISVDTETDGLNFRKNKLLLVQIANDFGDVIMIRRPTWQSERLKNKLESTNVIMHHALFDLQFLKMGMNLNIKKINCTKIFMKIVNPSLTSGLITSLREISKIYINKEQQMSDWNADKLSLEQLYYAANDVLYLSKLYKMIYKSATPEEKLIYFTALEGIKIKANLEVQGYTDLLNFDKEKTSVVLNNRNWWKKLKIESYQNNV